VVCTLFARGTGFDVDMDLKKKKIGTKTSKMEIWGNFLGRTTHIWSKYII
jgi:hypothetical protein